MATPGHAPAHHAYVVADLRRDLQEKADKAREDGRIFMMQEYIRLIASVNPQIKKIRSRFDREALASFRKEHKGLKKAAKGAQEAS